MTDKQIKERMEQTRVLRAACKAKYDYYGQLAHDRTLSRLNSMLVANIKRRSMPVVDGCR